jgi:hypothetical protein
MTFGILDTPTPRRKAYPLVDSKNIKIALDLLAQEEGMSFVYDLMVRLASDNEKLLSLSRKTYGYARGSYICQCNRCASNFVGDKRSVVCLECADTLLGL